MKKYILTVVLVLLTHVSHADLMAKGKIVKLDSTTGSPGTFAIQVEGAGGYQCNGNPRAISLSSFPDEKSFERTYALALTAFTAGYTVEVHSNPATPTCLYMYSMSIIND